MASPESEPRRSIAQVNRMLRSIVEAETLEQCFWVGGRIDRYYESELGHVYFDLVDDRKRIRCMLREERAGRYPFELRNHLDIEVYGDIHFYEERAEAQVNVLDLRAADDSAPSKPAIERLREEGLYPPRRRKSPARIQGIGIITSRSSRAIGDFENAYQSAGERGVLAPVSWKYVVLEGDRAIQSILDALSVLDEDPRVNVIAVMRGGGRTENLAVFDTYEIARAVARCNKYIVTGIGHHRDSTLADDLADFAASTPTAVAHYLAELCLRALSPQDALTPRHPGLPVAAVSAGAQRASHNPQSAAEPQTSSVEQPPYERPSFTSNLLILILLALAVASVAVLAAMLITQMQ